nr:NADH-quinone oxidoreductase subunit L [Chitinophagaceae bacterium]
HLHESPPAMTVPLIVLAILAFAGGLIGIPEILMQGGDRLGEFLSPVLKNSEIHVAHSTEMMLMVLSTVLVLIVIGISWMIYKKYRDVEAKGFGKFLQNKWYVDEMYDAVVVKPLKRLGSFLGNVFDKKIIDGIVNGVGRMVQYSGRQLRLLQSGQAGNYILLMVFSMVIIFVIQYFLRK